MRRNNIEKKKTKSNYSKNHVGQSLIPSKMEFFFISSIPFHAVVASIIRIFWQNTI